MKIWIHQALTLQWCHNERDGISHHWRLGCLHYCLFRCRKYQSSMSLAFVRRIHRWPVNFPHKGPVTRKMFPFDHVIMKIHNCIRNETAITGTHNQCYLPGRRDNFLSEWAHLWKETEINIKTSHEVNFWALLHYLFLLLICHCLCQL